MADRYADTAGVRTLFPRSLAIARACGAHSIPVPDAVSVALHLQRMQVPADNRFRLPQANTVLGPGRACQARLHVLQVKLDDIGVRCILPSLVVEQALTPGISLDERQLLLGPAGERQIAQRLVVDGEDAARGAILDRTF